MRNCTKVFYYVQHWPLNRHSVLPFGFTNNEKAAFRMFKRCPSCGDIFNCKGDQMDVRGFHKGRYFSYCKHYWSNGKIITQPLKYNIPRFNTWRDGL